MKRVLGQTSYYLRLEIHSLRYLGPEPWAWGLTIQANASCWCGNSGDNTSGPGTMRPFHPDAFSRSARITGMRSALERAGCWRQSCQRAARLSRQFRSLRVRAAECRDGVL